MLDTTWLSSASWSPLRTRNLDFSKPPWAFYTGCFSSNTLYVIHPLCLSPTSCFDNRVGCACHTMVSKTTFLFQPKPASIQPILKLTVMPHDIAIYETASSLSPLATRFWSPLTPFVWTNLSSLSFLFSYSDLFLVNLVLGVIFYPGAVKR